MGLGEPITLPSEHPSAFHVAWRIQPLPIQGVAPEDFSKSEYEFQIVASGSSQKDERKAHEVLASGLPEHQLAVVDPFFP